MAYSVEIKIRLPPQLKNELDKLAQEKLSNTSQVAREAIAAGLQQIKS